MIKLIVTFNDSMGNQPDITEEINIPSNICLYCLHDKPHNIDRLYLEVKKSLEYKGYEFQSYFEILKVYTL